MLYVFTNTNTINKPLIGLSVDWSLEAKSVLVNRSRLKVTWRRTRTNIKNPYDYNFDVILRYHNLPVVIWLRAHWCRRYPHFRTFQISVTLTLDRVIHHTFVYTHRRPLSTIKFRWNRKNFCGRTDIETETFITSSRRSRLNYYFVLYV